MRPRIIKKPLVALTVLLLLLLALPGCKPDQTEEVEYWKSYSQTLEAKLENERIEKEKALHGQNRLQSALGWAAAGAALCFVVGIVIGSGPKRRGQAKPSTSNSTNSSNTPT